MLDVIDRETVDLPPMPKGYGDGLPKPDAETKPIAMVAPGYFTEDGDRPPWERKRPPRSHTTNASPDNERNGKPPVA